MTQDTTDAIDEPPDPDPKSIKFELNGRSKHYRARRYGEARVNGRNYLKNIDTEVIFKGLKDRDAYNCTSCDSEAQRVVLSRSVILDRPNIYGSIEEIRCETVFYCRKCEETPKQRLPTIRQSDIPLNH